MKKALIIANMLSASASVFGMNNLLPENSNQASGVGYRQQIKNIKDLVNAEENDRQKIVKRFLKISNIRIREDVLGEAQTSDNPWNNESLTGFIKSESPKSMQKFLSNIRIPGLIVNLEKAQVEDILNTSHILSQITKNFANVDGVLQLLLFYKNKRPVSIEGIENLRTSVLGGVSLLLEILYQKDPLHDGCKSGNEKIVKYLVEHGADVNKEDKDGKTPLFGACWEGHENIVKYLVEHRANVNEEDEDGRTPLFEACRKGNENIVKYLVEHGADVNKEDKDGKTPLLTARRKGNENIVKYLVEHGAGVNKEDKD